MASTPSPVALLAITACVAVAGAGAGILLQPTKDRVEPRPPGADVGIPGVATREPFPEPGGVMDVGEPAYGYRHPGDAPPVSIVIGSDAASGDTPPRAVGPGRGYRSPQLELRPAPAPIPAESRARPNQWPSGLDQSVPEHAERRERRADIDEQLRLQQARRAERSDDRPPWPQPLDARGREAYPAGAGAGRERQWYRDDGRPVAAPDRRY